MATVILALVTIALEAILLHRHKAMTATRILNAEGRPFEVSFFRPLQVYYSIFILAEVFAVGLLWDAVRLVIRCLDEKQMNIDDLLTTDQVFNGNVPFVRRFTRTHFNLWRLPFLSGAWYRTRACRSGNTIN